MKLFKTGMRLWILVASFFSFLLGWVFFAHANKPAPLFADQTTQATAQAVEPAAAPVEIQQPSLRSSRSLFLVEPPARTLRPRLRTGGS
jgi:hypothetical protein